jgi:23S rRNA A2030 N6-methylase RlmJ
MRTGSSFFEVLLCTGVSVSLALAVIGYIAPAKEQIIDGFKNYTDTLESFQDSENIKATPGGIELLKKIYDSIDNRTVIVKLSDEEIKLLKFLSEI